MSQLRFGILDAVVFLYGGIICQFPKPVICFDEFNCCSEQIDGHCFSSTLLTVLVRIRQLGSLGYSYKKGLAMDSGL